MYVCFSCLLFLQILLGCLLPLCFLNFEWEFPIFLGNLLVEILWDLVWTWVPPGSMYFAFTCNKAGTAAFLFSAEKFLITWAVGKFALKTHVKATCNYKILKDISVSFMWHELWDRYMVFVLFHFGFGFLSCVMYFLVPFGW